MDLTVSCSCGRKMRSLGVQGVARYRCGCGIQISIEGLPTNSATTCSVMRGRRACNAQKSPSHMTCLRCACSVTFAVLRTPELRSQLAEREGEIEFINEQAEGRRRAMQQWEDEVEQRRHRRALTNYNVVYYVLTRPGVVKIGTTTHLQSRIRALRIPSVDDVLAAEPGTQKLEAVRHRQFADLAVPGRLREDFHLDERLQAHIDALVQKHGKPYDLAEAIMTRQREDLAKARVGHVSSGKIRSLSNRLPTQPKPDS